MTEEREGAVETLPSSRVHRLVLAAAIAPTLRSQKHAVMKRRWKTYDPVTGETTGETTLDEVQKGLLKLHEIEFDLGPGARPKTSICILCSKLVSIPAKGPIPNRCTDCRSSVCPDCGKAKGRNAKRCTACRWLHKKKPDQVCCTDCNKPLYSTESMRVALHSKTDDGRRAGRCAACRRATARKAACSICNKNLRPYVMSAKSIARRKGKPPVCPSCRKMPVPRCSDCTKELRKTVAIAARKKGTKDLRCRTCSNKRRKEEATLRQTVSCACERKPVTNKRCEDCKRVRCHKCKKRLAYASSMSWVYRQKKSGQKLKEWPLPTCKSCFNPLLDKGGQKHS